MKEEGAPAKERVEEIMSDAIDMPPGKWFRKALGSLECTYCDYKVPTEAQRPDWDTGMRIYQMVAHFAIRHAEKMSYVVLSGVKFEISGRVPVPEADAIRMKLLAHAAEELAKGLERKDDLAAYHQAVTACRISGVNEEALHEVDLLRLPEGKKG